MKEKYKCKVCNKNRIRVNSGNKGSNGAYIKYDLKGRRLFGCVCIFCQRAIQRSRFKETKGIYYKKYEKTHSGFLMRLYRNMKSRILGIQKAKHHLYKGKFILSKNSFYKWAEQNEEFLRLFLIWSQNNYDRKLTPSVDRVDSSKGYRLSNMEWVTHSENSRRGTMSRYAKNRQTEDQDQL